ncbi:MAG: prepilin-type N-terminal cleavage/methylation domain-containing protein [Planctomycetia bacterium]
MILLLATPTPHLETRRSRCIGGRKLSGITLVELLVTLVVLSILASLSLSGMLVARARAKEARSVSTIRKLSEVVLPYYEQYETRRPVLSAADTTALLASPSGRANYATAKQIALRRLMALELPERILDVGVGPGGAVSTTWAGPVGGVPVTLDETPPVTRRYRNLITADMSRISGWDGGELLHLIITRGPAADPDIISHFRDDEIADRDGDGLLEFIDGWGRGINFKRWPTGFASPMQPVDGTSRNIDGLVSPNGHRLVPLIYSAGNDGEFAIEEMPGLTYGSVGLAYDPFAYNLATDQSLVAADTSPVAPAVVLVPVRRPGTGPVTFVASEIGRQVPGNVDGFPTRPNAAFQTVGSVTGRGARDNVTNHDLTR